MQIQKKPKLAVWKFASCDGCQLTLLNLEEELLILDRFATIAYFPEASSKILKGPYDISFVEGSITTEEDAARIHQIRRSSKVLIAIGACATSGGIQALRNFATAGAFAAVVYPQPETIRTLDTATPISHHVSVDFELQGCPIHKDQLRATLAALLQGRKPALQNYSVCQDCKLRGVTCILVTKGVNCLGPVTRAGCGAICPSYQRACYGCFGPKEEANVNEISKIFEQNGASQTEIMNLFRSFNAWAGAFREKGDVYGRSKS